MSAIPSLAQLKQAVQLCEQIEKLQAELETLLNSSRSALPTKAQPTLPTPSRRAAVSAAATGSRVSAQGSQRIAAAQRRRWARFRRDRKEAAERTADAPPSTEHQSPDDSATEN